MAGRIGNVSDADNFYSVVTVPDVADCAAHGDLMWRQFYNLVRAGVQGIYILMYDEYNEGNQIAKTAESQAWSPSGGGMLALDEGGTA
ncbi:hypothetical protein [Streptomyces sp. GESEQ-35]|uniref:hypothetical protein n=1 Tax=Streptomyces sp. GESEQ-35 TaxID=2812657 RepID=UPI0027E25689|nr:hypothetical protein [Streptomyces sp. GESEQ-35]